MTDLQTGEMRVFGTIPTKKTMKKKKPSPRAIIGKLYPLQNIL